MSPSAWRSSGSVAGPRCSRHLKTACVLNKLQQRNQTAGAAGAAWTGREHLAEVAKCFSHQVTCKLSRYKVHITHTRRDYAHLKHIR